MQRLRLHRMMAAVSSAVATTTALPPGAHHSFAAYENVKTPMLNGTVKDFQWRSPPVLFDVLERREDSSQSLLWKIITSGPDVLTRFGWNKDFIHPGERVRIVGEILQTKLSPSTGEGAATP